MRPPKSVKIESTAQGRKSGGKFAEIGQIGQKEELSEIFRQLFSYSDSSTLYSARAAPSWEGGRGVGLLPRHPAAFCFPHTELSARRASRGGQKVSVSSSKRSPSLPRVGFTASFWRSAATEEFRSTKSAPAPASPRGEAGAGAGDEVHTIAHLIAPSSGADLLAPSLGAFLVAFGKGDHTICGAFLRNGG